MRCRPPSLDAFTALPSSSATVGPRDGAGAASRHNLTSSSSGAFSQPSGIGYSRFRVDPDWKHSQPLERPWSLAAASRTGDTGCTSHTSHVMPILSTKVRCAIFGLVVEKLPALSAVPATAIE